MSPFAKYHGLGNDFLLVDGTRGEPSQAWADMARRLCDRHRGVGADGMIVALPGTPAVPGRAGPDGSEGSDGSEGPDVSEIPLRTAVTMLLHNADGGRAEMSGNGIRCLALFVREVGLVAASDFVIATDAGPRRVRVGEPAVPGLAQVGVEMGSPTVGQVEVDVPDPLGGGSGWRGRSVDVGNPHLVLVADELEELDLQLLGPALEADGRGGLNVEWVRARHGVDELDLRVWERGVGVTLACGTGSVAAASAAIAMGLVRGPNVLVHNPGGTLEVNLSQDSAWLSGPAQRIAWLDPSPDLLAGPAADDPAPEPDDWAVAAEGAVEWHWDWASGAGWGTRYG